jgi:hypothetical protein
MKCVCNICSAILFLVCLAPLNGQSGRIKGKVVDIANGRLIEYANVLNYSSQQQTFSNSSGEFKLDAASGDTLVIFALGYYYKKSIVDESMMDNDHAAFSLLELPYELNEARIPVIGTYEEFKRAFVALNRKESKVEQANQRLALLAKNVGREAYKEAMDKKHAEGVTFYSMPILSSEEKERIKLAKIIDREQIHNAIYQKFNPVLVRQVTGLTNDDEIVEFMVFCNFTEKYLLEVNEYDLSTRVALKYELFKKKKQDEQLMEKPLNLLGYSVNMLS